MDNSALSYLISEQIKTLPGLTLKSNIAGLTSAARLVAEGIEQRVPEVADDEQPLEAEKVVEKVTETEGELQEDEGFKACYGDLARIANRLGAAAVQTINMLDNEVTEDVDSLENSIKERAEEILVDEGQQAVVDKPVEAHFKVLKWDKYLNAMGGVESLGEHYKTLLHANPSYDFIDLKYAIGKPEFKIEALNFHPETKQDIIRRVSEKAGNAAQRMAVIKLYEAATDPYTYDGLLRNTVGELCTASSLGKALRGTCNVLAGIRPMLQIFKKTPLDITNEMNDQLHANLDKVENLFNLMGYALVATRKNFQNAYLIDEDTVNGDQEEALEESGATPEDAQMMLDAMYKAPGLEVPLNGISVKAIAENKQQIRASYAKHAAALKSDAINVQQKAIVRAGMEVLSQYLESTPESRLPQGLTKEQFLKANLPHVQSHLGLLNLNGDHSLNTMLYDFVLSTHYSETMAPELHRLLGKEVVEHLKLTPNMSSEDLLLVKVSAVAKMISEFIVDKFCDVD